MEVRNPAAIPPWKEVAVTVAVVLPFLGWVLGRTLWLDFWYDEVFTLRSYGFGPLSVVLTDYGTPNNHVFFNVVDWAWLRLAGVETLEALMDRPWVARLPSLACTVGTIGYVHAGARRMFGVRAAWFAVAVLVTTVPFFNFAVQVRGYALSMLLVAALVHHSAAFVHEGRWRDAALTFVATGLLLWTIPSNLYFVLALLGSLAGPALVRLRRGGTGVRGEPSLVAAGAVAGGIVLAVVLYAPVLGQIAGSKFVAAEAMFRRATLSETAPSVLASFVSARWIAVAGILAGAAAALAAPRGRERGTLVLLAVLLGAPFVLSWARGDRPYGRVFVSLVPVFAVLAGAGAARAVAALPRLHALPASVAVGFAAYCAATFAGELAAIDRRLADDIEDGRRSQGLYYHYALAHYEPREVAARVRAEGAKSVVFAGGDLTAMPAYLEKAGIEVRGLAALRRARPGPVLVVTSFPNAARRRLAALGWTRVDRLGRRARFHALLRVRTAARQG